MDPNYQWKLEDIYQTNEQWEEHLKQIEDTLPAVEALKGTLGTPDGLLNAVETLLSVSEASERLYVYAHMRRDEDNGNAQYQAMTDRAMSLAVRFDTISAFFTPELIALGSKKVEELVKQQPRLKEYRHYLDKILRMEKHTLSPAEEALLAAAGEVTSAPDTIYSMLTDADLTFPMITGEHREKIEVTHGRYIPLLQHRIRRIRKNAYESLYSSYKAHANTITASYAASVKADEFYATARKYPSALEASLAPNAIPVSVYDALIEAVHEHLPALHRYVKLRKRALNYKRGQLCHYDLYVPITPEAKLGLPFEEACKLVKQGLAPLGESYLTDLQQAFDGHWIDVFENKGKTSGAYSWGVYDTHPYVLLNYNENLDSIFTLAHELGHTMHSYYSNTAQSYANAGYPLFLAEIASTTNEALLLDHLKGVLKRKTQQMALLNHELEQIRGTVFRQTMFAEFERKAHEMAERGESLTKENLCALYANLNEQYYGPLVETDDFIPYEWMRIPHFYNAYYVYQYATGYSAAVAFSRAIKKEGAPAQQRYLGFLSAGASKDPLEVLKDAGLDMTKPDAVNMCMEAFEESLHELDKLLRE